MSLDVMLSGEETEEQCRCPHCDHEHMRKVRTEYFSSNITHNLNAMAEEAGIYKHCWRPEELGITKANQLILPLAAAVKLMESDPERFKKHNASNGWGLYKHFLPWVNQYLQACRNYPDANVSVSR